mgnify:CR=1 FL=1
MTELIDVLVGMGFRRVERGPLNPATGHGWYSHPCEYRRGHIRVRINERGCMVLRDPGAGLELPAGRGTWTPNAARIDSFDPRKIENAVRLFASRPAFSLDEALAVSRNR